VGCARSLILTASRALPGEGLVVGVGTHLDTHTAAVCDARGQELARLQVSAVPEGYTAGAELGPRD
jgi:hypothetical protein